jgi:hypothetical protein
VSVQAPVGMQVGYTIHACYVTSYSSRELNGKHAIYIRSKEYALPLRFIMYRVSQEECAILREGVPCMSKVERLRR